MKKTLARRTAHGCCTKHLVSCYGYTTIGSTTTNRSEHRYPPLPPPLSPCLLSRAAGSCNGFRHYAALQIDAKGWARVDLVPSPKPRGVYKGLYDMTKKDVSE